MAGKGSKWIHLSFHVVNTSAVRAETNAYLNDLLVLLEGDHDAEVVSMTTDAVVRNNGEVGVVVTTIYNAPNRIEGIPD
jgi:hypothetical protein